MTTSRWTLQALLAASACLATACSLNKGAPHAVLKIDAAGVYQLQARPVPTDQLRQALTAAAAASPGLLLEIEADPKAAYPFVGQAVAAAKQAGIARIAFVGPAVASAVGADPSSAPE
jgi:biopolymer transport protein ExbD